jgi:hypothetical protein
VAGGGTEAVGQPRAAADGSAKAAAAAGRPQAAAAVGWVNLGQGNCGPGRPRAVGISAEATTATGQPRAVAAGRPRAVATAIDRPRAVQGWHLDSERRQRCVDPERWWWRLDDPEWWRASFLPHPTVVP